MFLSGKTLKDISEKEYSFEHQVQFFASRQLSSTEDGLMEKFFIQNLIERVSVLLSIPDNHLMFSI